jgi:hypothetical protein
MFSPDVISMNTTTKMLPPPTDFMAYIINNIFGRETTERCNDIMVKHPPYTQPRGGLVVVAAAAWFSI